MSTNTSSSLAVKAFLNWENYNSNDFKVVADDFSSSLFYQSSRIAIVFEDKEIYLSTKGKFCPVVVEALNKIPNINITEKKSGWYLNATAWSGEASAI